MRVTGTFWNGVERQGSMPCGEEAGGNPGGLHEGEENGLPDVGPLLDPVEEGFAKALLCCNGPGCREIAAVLEELGFRVFRAEDAAAAAKKLQHNEYDVILFDEAFSPGDPMNSGILDPLRGFPMEVRRRSIIGLLLGSLPPIEETGLEAFRRGVDLVLPSGGSHEVKRLLARAVRDHHALYAIFKDELKRKGQL